MTAAEKYSGTYPIKTHGISGEGGRFARVSMAGFWPSGREEGSREYNPFSQAPQRSFSQSCGNCQGNMRGWEFFVWEVEVGGWVWVPWEVSGGREGMGIYGPPDSDGARLRDTKDEKRIQIKRRKIYGGKISEKTSLINYKDQLCM